MIKRKNSKSRLIIVGSLFIVIGFLLIGGKCLYDNFQNQKDKQLIDAFFYEQKEIIENQNLEKSKENNENKNSKKELKENYIAVIKIPKIGLEKGLFSRKSSSNNVNKNIFILNESNLPNEEKGNIILAGHSGSGRTAYFKNLYKLERDDEISIFYDAKEFKYKVVNQYEIEKNGTAHIIRNAEKSTLTLITCKRNTNKQIVYICELFEERGM